MGKSIIIKGTDFSACDFGQISFPEGTTVWYMDWQDLLAGANNPTTYVTAPFGYYSNARFIGHPINMLRVNVAAIGTFTLYKVDAYATASSVDTVVKTWTLTATGVQTLYLDSTLYISEGQGLGFAATTDTSTLNYYGFTTLPALPSTADAGFLMGAHMATASGLDYYLMIDVGYTELI